MLNLHTRLRPNDEEVAAKVLDGEAIMINLSNGIYYSMAKVGGLIWELIAAGGSLGQIVTVLTERYDVSAEQAQVDVRRVAEELLQEKLVLMSDQSTPVLELSPAAAEATLSYEPPKLEIYRDIGHLIALDPPMPGLKDVPWNEPTDRR